MSTNVAGKAVPYVAPFLVSIANSFKSMLAIGLSGPQEMELPFLDLFMASKLKYRDFLDEWKNEAFNLWKLVTRSEPSRARLAAEREHIRKLDGPFLLKACAEIKAQLEVPITKESKAKGQVKYICSCVDLASNLAAMHD